MIAVRDNTVQNSTRLVVPVWCHMELRDDGRQKTRSHLGIGIQIVDALLLRRSITAIRHICTLNIFEIQALDKKRESQRRVAANLKTLNGLLEGENGRLA